LVLPGARSMRFVYISGAISAKDYWEREQNIRRAEDAFVAISRLGLSAYLPHTIARYAEGALPLQEWLRRDFNVMRRCDGIVMVKGWETSKGANTEKAYAEQIGLAVFEWPTDLQALREWGYAPSKVGCVNCGKELEGYKRLLKEPLPGDN